MRGEEGERIDTELRVTTQDKVHIIIIYLFVVDNDERVIMKDE